MGQIAEAAIAVAEGPRTSLISRNITVKGRRTSVRLEPEMWTALRDISKRESCSIHDICTLIDLRKNENTSLTAAIRVFLMLYFRAASTEEGHRRAGHGNFLFMCQRARITEENMGFFGVLRKAKQAPSNANGGLMVHDRRQAGSLRVSTA